MTGVTITDPSNVDHADADSFQYTIPGTHALNVPVATTWRITNNTGSSLVVAEFQEVEVNFGIEAYNSPALPQTLANGDHLDISITFTPTSLGNEEEGGFAASWRLLDDVEARIVQSIAVRIENVVESLGGGGSLGIGIGVGLAIRWGIGVAP